MNPGSKGHTGDTGRTEMFEPKMTAPTRGSTIENDLDRKKRLWLDGNAGDGVDSSTGDGVGHTSY